MATNAFLYYTHFVDEGVKREIQRLRRHLSSDFSLFAMGCCVDRGGLDELEADGVTIRPYLRADLKALPYPRQLANVDWKTLRKNPDLAIMRFFHGNPDFDYYWILEYDVRYTGDWGEFLDELCGSSADLLCAHFSSLRQSPDWVHWGSFSSADVNVVAADMVRAFLPFTRLSKEMMRAIDERCRNGWTGHPEVLWPTIAKTSGLQIEEIGGLGPSVPSNRRGKYYHSATAPSGIFFSTFAAWPIYSGKNAFQETSPKDILWHPVKN
jgi:hypothetical protein